MYKVKLIYSNGEEKILDDESDICDTYEEAVEHAQYMCSCYKQGCEIFEEMDPDEYPNPHNEIEYEIIEE